MIRVFVNAVEYIRNNYNYPFCCGKTIEYVNIKELIGSLESNDVVIVKNLEDFGDNQKEIFEALYYIYKKHADLCVVFDQGISTARFVVAGYKERNNSGGEFSTIFDPVGDVPFFKLYIDKEKSRHIAIYNERLFSLIVDEQEIQMKKNFGNIYWNYMMGKKTMEDVLTIIESEEYFKKLSAEYEKTIEYFVVLKTIDSNMIVLPKQSDIDLKFLLEFVKEKQNIGLIQKNLEKIQLYYDVGQIDAWRIICMLRNSHAYCKLIKEDENFRMSQIAIDIENRYQQIMNDPDGFLLKEENIDIYSYS